MSSGHLTIGQFAAAARLSLRALRHYDELGVLVPAAVDPQTGYRSYVPQQLEQARAIRLLRAAGMPLPRIARLGGASAEELAATLAAWRAELDAEHERRVDALDVATGLLAGDAPPGAEPVDVCEVPRHHALAVRHDGVTLDALGTLLATAFDELATRAGDAAAGTPYTVFHRPVDDGVPGDVEVRQPVDPPLDGAIEVPATHAACLIVTGANARPPRLLAAYERVAEAAGARGHALAGPPYERALGLDALEVLWPVDPARS